VSKPAFLITIDTEGDNLWSRPRTITTRNSGFLPRFQELCEAHGFKPTWLTNWEMANCPVFREFGRDVLRRRTGEIGMHLHAWNNPPLAPLTEDDTAHMPFLIEYPEPVMREKVSRLTAALEDAFGTRMVSHRAGRWSFNATYARVLVEHGYRLDCSVTPHVSWRIEKGDPNGKGGTDFSRFPELPYFVDVDDISRPGRSSLLEAPMTIIPRPQPSLVAAARRTVGRTRLGRRALDRVAPAVAWLRPNGRNTRLLLWLLEVVERERRPYAEFMLHSSEFMPGGNPIFPNASDVERLYAQLRELFSAAAGRFRGLTLDEFDAEFRTRALT
jgi:peptidoglycan/xylan/chitin deacetylase (PgdA/CDA1 family)